MPDRDRRPPCDFGEGERVDLGGVVGGEGGEERGLAAGGQGEGEGEGAVEVFENSDRLRIRAAQPQPGFLDGVLGVAHRAEHAVGDRPQARAVALELVRDQLVLVCHRDLPLIVGRARRALTNMTKSSARM